MRAPITVAILLLGSHLVEGVPPPKLRCDVTGTWEVVSSRWGGKAGDLNGARWLLVVSGSHWAQVAQREDGQPINLGDFGTVPVFAAAGSYTVRADTFVTQTTAHVIADLRGKTFSYACQVIGDRWVRTTEMFGASLQEELRRVGP